MEARIIVRTPKGYKRVKQGVTIRKDFLLYDSTDNTWKPFRPFEIGLAVCPGEKVIRPERVGKAGGR